MGCSLAWRRSHGGALHTAFTPRFKPVHHLPIAETPSVEGISRRGAFIRFPSLSSYSKAASVRWMYTIFRVLKERVHLRHQTGILRVCSPGPSSEPDQSAVEPPGPFRGLQDVPISLNRLNNRPNPWSARKTAPNPPEHPPKPDLSFEGVAQHHRSRLWLSRSVL